MDSKKTKLNPSLQTLVERAAKLSHRSLILLKGEDLTVNLSYLHFCVAKSTNYANSSILWCYKYDEDNNSTISKTRKKYKKLKSKNVELSELSSFDLLLHTQDIQFSPYTDTQAILGNTYGLCILQDLKCLTPNILCRVVETVSGGGAVVLALQADDLDSFREMNMDAHYRLTTHSHPNAVKLFNKRLVTSLSSCKNCIILDSDLQSCDSDLKLMAIKKVSSQELATQESLAAKLQETIDSMADAEKPLPDLIALCRTPDQGTALLKLVDVITEKRSREIVSITAGRGRGKSAVLGLAVSAALDLGLSNIFVTSPSPNNLHSFFQMLFKGFDALGYEESKDYEILQSTNPDFHKAIVRVNVFKKHRQTVQYILPSDTDKLQQAELVVVDEAAAIPLPTVQAMLGEHITFMSSTIAGYEGTGRSLSLKLLKKLRNKTVHAKKRSSAVQSSNAIEVQELHEVSLEHPIRYGEGDPVEQWLFRLLCLHASDEDLAVSELCAPQECRLYYVNKEVLFSGSQKTDSVLSKIQSLLVSSHYRNSPDDLQMLADAPAHHLYVLSPKIKSSGNLMAVPDILCVIQVSFEGGVSSKVSHKVIKKGERPSGDLVPWGLATYFTEHTLAGHKGVRVVRVASHPDYQSMGYGGKAIELLQHYYSGKLYNYSNEETEEEGSCLYTDLSTKVPEGISYLSTSYGVTPQLYRFWAKAGFIPLTIGQTVNRNTGEHNCVMVNPIGEEGNPQWVMECAKEFMRRFVELLGGSLRTLHPMLVHSICMSHMQLFEEEDVKEIAWKDVACHLTGHDLRRLEKYVKNVSDRHLITDLITPIASLYCKQIFKHKQISALQSALILGSGLQFRELVEVGKDLDLVPESAMGNFRRAMAVIHSVLAEIQEKVYADKLQSVVPELHMPVNITAKQDLERMAKDMEAENPDLHFSRKRKTLEDYERKPMRKDSKKKRKPKYSYPT